MSPNNKQLKKKSIFFVILFFLIYSAILIYTGAYIIKKGYDYYLKNLYQNSFKNPLSILTVTQNTGQLSAQYKWIKLPIKEKSRYGGLIFNKDLGYFIYASQNGLFFNVSKTGEVYANNDIPKIFIKKYKNVANFIEKDRLGVRNLFYDEHDKSFTALISKYNEIDKCHYIEIILLPHQSDEWKKIDNSVCWNYGTTGSIGGGLVKNKQNIFYSTGFNTLMYPQNVPTNLDKKIQKDMLGKIFKYNISSNSKSIYASGLRNPLGLTLSDNNKIYEIEMGPQGGDEINIIEENENYGYPYQTLGVDYGKKNWPFQKEISHKLPIYSFIPSSGPSDIIFDNNYEKNNLADCLLLMTTLRNESLYRIILNQNCSQIQSIERLNLDKRLRRIAVSHGDYSVYAITTDGTNEIALLEFR